MGHWLRAFMLILASGWAAGAAAQEAGRVILSIGEVTIQRGADTRPAPIGSVVQNGDTVRVGASSNGQIRFVDEAIVALRPGTELKVDDYNWPGAANGLERAFFSLVKGGLRTVTGIIGKANQQNYNFITPTSTIGIRGTNFNLVHCDTECANRDGSPAPGGTYGGIFDGRIGVSNDAGERVFGVNEFFYVANRSTPAEGLIGPPPFLGDRLAGATRRQGQKGTESSETMAQSGINADSRPLASPAPAPAQTFVATEERVVGGALAVLSEPITHFLSMASVSLDGVGDANTGGLNVSRMTFAGSGAGEMLVSWEFPQDLNGLHGRGFVGPSGTDMVGYGASVNAHWGRWIDGQVMDDTAPPSRFATPPGGVHYLYSDQITTAEVIGAKTGLFSYNVSVGGTNPTDSTGAIGAFTGGSVSVNFTTRTAALTAAFNVGGSNYSIASAAGNIIVTPGAGARVDSQVFNNGTCTGPCGGTPGPIQAVRWTGGFLGATGNHLSTSIGTSTANATLSTSQVRLFFCPTCP